MKNPSLKYYDISISLYVPSINQNLPEIVNREKFPNLKSVIICLEDSILDSQVEDGEKNLQKLLANLNEKKMIIFIRARNFEHFKKVLTFPNIHKIDGFVIPKFDLDNMDKYLPFFQKDFYFMPVIEGRDSFDISRLQKIRNILLDYFDSILSIRIGSEDIGNILKIKRECGSIIYDIPIFSAVITNIISTFKPYGFNVTAPVFSCYKDVELFKQELKIDIQNGLLGKTLIHPSQIEIMVDMYKISKKQLAEAEKSLEIQNSAVVGLNGNMIETITHKNWAKEIIIRSKVYGVK